MCCTFARCFQSEQVSILCEKIQIPVCGWSKWPFWDLRSSFTTSYFWKRASNNSKTVVVMSAVTFWPWERYFSTPAAQYHMWSVCQAALLKSCARNIHMSWKISINWLHFHCASHRVMPSLQVWGRPCLSSGINLRDYFQPWKVWKQIHLCLTNTLTFLRPIKNHFWDFILFNNLDIDFLRSMKSF